MKSIKLFIFIAITCLQFGCASLERVDETYTQKTPGFSKIYSISKSKCIESVKKSLKDMGTSAEEIQSDKIISERWEFMKMAEAVSSNFQYSAYSTAIQYSIAAKLYIDVEDIGKEKCEVRISKVRAWENTSEYEKLDVAQVKSKITVPFFKNLDERVSH